MPFNNVVDPDGILTHAMSHDDKFTHTNDNEVDYYERITDNNQLIRQVFVSTTNIEELMFNSYEPINPMRFRAGDIVEAQLSFAGVPLKNCKYKMLLVLRALTIMDTSPLRVCLCMQQK